jgi:hypothetical protein
MEAVKYPRRVTRSIVCFHILHVYGIVRLFTSGRRAASRMEYKSSGDYFTYVRRQCTSSTIKASTNKSN